MSITSPTPAMREAGFTVVEVLVALALVLVISLGVFALWGTIERSGVESGDRMVTLIQGRVAVARLERDLRLASAQDAPFSTDGAVLDATPTQVVFLMRDDAASLPSLVEWELTGANLMRRKGACPAARPVAFAHNLYSDNKTMLEGLASGSELQYFIGGREVEPPLVAAQLSLVDEVRLRASTAPAGATRVAVVNGGCKVGR